jgi:hypothetical protein
MTLFFISIGIIAVAYGVLLYIEHRCAPKLTKEEQDDISKEMRLWR